MYSSYPLDKTEQFGTIWTFLAPSLRIRKPTKLFSTDENGFNLETLVSRCGKAAPLIIIIKSMKRNIFGAFIPVPLEKNHSINPIFFGTGETFLFSVFPIPKKYKWTEANQHFCLIESGYLRVGGPERGLWIDDALDSGNCETCQTFDNQPLNGGTSKFTCLGLEIFTC